MTMAAHIKSEGCGSVFKHRGANIYRVAQSESPLIAVDAMEPRAKRSATHRLYPEGR